MTNREYFNFITSRILSDAEEIFPSPLELKFQDLFASEPFQEGKVFRDTLSWLSKNGYIEVEPPISGTEDTYRITLTEKSLCLLGLPSSLKKKTTIRDAIAAALRIGKKEALSTAVHEIIKAGIALKLS